MPRRSSRPLVEHSISMSVYDLFRAARVRPGQDGKGVMRWWRSFRGELVEPSGTVGFVVVMTDRDTAHVTLVYGRAGETVEQRIELAWTTPHFGGRWWWFLCPMTGVLAGRLYYNGQRGAFACRQWHRLDYFTQRTTKLQTGHERQTKLYRCLGLRYPPARDELPRPKGMHHRTYARLRAEIEATEDRMNAAWLPVVARMLARGSRAAE